MPDAERPREVTLVMPVDDAVLVRSALATVHRAIDRDTIGAPTNADELARRYGAVWGYVALEIAKAAHPSSAPLDPIVPA